MKHKRRNIFIVIMLILFLGLADKSLTAQFNVVEYSDGKRFRDHVVFYPQHQDDEVLWGVSAITNAIKECGADNVYIVLVSDGSGVNVFMKNPRFWGLSRKEKEELRNNEFKAALYELGIKDKNILILADKDKKEGTHYELMEETILKFEKELGSVTHIAHHYKYDDHIMHRKNGETLKKLSDEHKVNDARYFMKPAYVKNILEDKREYYKSETDMDRERARKSLDQYKIVDEKNQKLGIGYVSAHSYFDHLYRDSNYTSILSVY